MLMLSGHFQAQVSSSIIQSHDLEVERSSSHWSEDYGTDISTYSYSATSTSLPRAPASKPNWRNRLCTLVSCCRARKTQSAVDISAKNLPQLPQTTSTDSRPGIPESNLSRMTSLLSMHAKKELEEMMKNPLQKESLHSRKDSNVPDTLAKKKNCCGCLRCCKQKSIDHTLEQKKRKSIYSIASSLSSKAYSKTYSVSSRGTSLYSRKTNRDKHSRRKSKCRICFCCCRRKSEDRKSELKEKKSTHSKMSSRPSKKELKETKDLTFAPSTMSTKPSRQEFNVFRDIKSSQSKLSTKPSRQDLKGTKVKSKGTLCSCCCKRTAVLSPPSLTDVHKTSSPSSFYFSSSYESY